MVAAYAAIRERLQQVDYALLDEAVVGEANVEIETALAKFPDDHVNTRHRDLVKLTGLKLVAIARLILACGSIDRVPPKQVAALIRRADFDRAKCRLKSEEWRKIDETPTS